MITKQPWILLLVSICTLFTPGFASDTPHDHEKDTKVVVITDMKDDELEDLRKKMLYALQDHHAGTGEQQCTVEHAKILQEEINAHTQTLEHEAGNANYIKVQIGKHGFTMAKALFHWALNHLKNNALKYALKAYCYYYGYSTFTVDTVFQIIAAQNMADSLSNNKATPFSFGSYLFGLALYDRSHGTQ